MQKYAYIIPGFMENANSRKAYRQVASLFRKQGYTPIIVKITWKNRTMSDYVNEFKSQVKGDVKDSVFFGFSFGAMIALITSVTYPCKALILCSLASYFNEDLPHLRKWWLNVLGKRRIADLRTFKFSKIAKKIKSHVFILAGTEELEKWKQFKRRSLTAQKLLHTHLIIVDGVGHDIGHPAYFSRIRKLLEDL